MSIWSFVVGGAIAIGAMVLTLNGCGSSSAVGTMPYITPPVTAAAPTGLTSSTRAAGSRVAGTRTLDSADIRTRFFTSGPTNLLRILTDIDTLISSINTRSAGAPCLSTTPVAYTITPWGQTVTMYAQCYEILSGATATDPKLLQWGVKDGVTYLYSAVGAERVAAMMTPITSAPGTYQVQAWLGVGYTNSTCGSGTWDSCSYGVMQLSADSNARTFELAVAGVGFGYCGAQLKSDGTNVYAEGSNDMGTTCTAIDTLCVDATNVTTPSTCTAPLTTFALPSLGRISVVGSNVPPINGGTFDDCTFPGTGANVTVNGTASDALYFGPLTHTTGVTLFP